MAHLEYKHGLQYYDESALDNLNVPEQHDKVLQGALLHHTGFDPATRNSFTIDITTGKGVLIIHLGRKHPVGWPVPQHFIDVQKYTTAFMLR